MPTFACFDLDLFERDCLSKEEYILGLTDYGRYGVCNLLVVVIFESFAAMLIL
jgi:hypothetical protein